MQTIAKHFCKVLAALRASALQTIAQLPHRADFDIFEKPTMKLDLQKNREKNQIAVVWSGSDSQGLHFSGEVHYVLCSSRAYSEHVRKMQQRDPGATLRHYVCKPSQGSTVPFVAELDVLTLEMTR